MLSRVEDFDFSHSARSSARFFVSSPNGSVRTSVFLERGRIYYSIDFYGRSIIRRSRLGFLLRDEHNLAEDFLLTCVSRRNFSETWEALWGEERKILNRYNELKFDLRQSCDGDRGLSLFVRTFDEGVAFRYELIGEGEIIIDDELTEFYVDPEDDAWSIPAFLPDRYEYDYEKRKVHELWGSVHTPVTFRSVDGDYFSIHEAALYDYGGMTVEKYGETLKANITPLSDGSKARLTLPFSSPWRMIMISRDAVGLTRNRMMLNLNEAPSGDFSWVRDLKFIGIWWEMYVKESTWSKGDKHGATTENAKKYIDKCAELGFGGVLAEGWNEGWEGDWLETGAHADFLQSTPDFDIEEVSRYARDRGIEWIAHHETVGFVDNYESQIEDAYKLLAKNDIHYIKSGYAGAKMMIDGNMEYHHSQKGVRHYQRALGLATQYHIMLDVHEPIKSTGIERTFPNLMTREGARGQEYESGVIRIDHATILPFTRLLAGGMDYTPGILDVKNSVRPMRTTIIRQLAFYLTIYSALQMAADRPEFYEKYPDLTEFIARIPTKFEKSIPLGGEIGEFFVVARQEWKAHEWFIGGVTNDAAREFELDFGFLDPDMHYKMTIYYDAEDAHYLENPDKYEIQEVYIDKQNKFVVKMAPGGGFVAKIEPA